MPWNTIVTGIERVARNIYVLMKDDPIDDHTKKTMMYEAGGVPAMHKRYMYASKAAYELIKSKYPKAITPNGFKNPASSIFCIEHAIPNKYAVDCLAELPNRGDYTIDDIQHILSKLVCVLVLKEDNKRLNEKYKSTMPEGWTFNDDPLIRYRETGITVVDTNGNEV